MFQRYLFREALLGKSTQLGYTHTHTHAKTQAEEGEKIREEDASRPDSRDRRLCLGNPPKAGRQRRLGDVTFSGGAAGAEGERSPTGPPHWGLNFDGTEGGGKESWRTEARRRDGMRVRQREESWTSFREKEKEG